MKRVIYSAVFVLLGAFLLYRYATGGLAVYIHPRFNGLIVAAAAGALLLAAASARRDPSGKNVSWFGVLMVGGASVVGLAVTPTPLGSAAATKRGMELPAVREAPAIPTASPSAAAAPHETITNVVEGFEYVRKFEGLNDRLEGVRVDVTGFVHREHEFVSDYVAVARFTVSCCAADASPVGLLVRSPDAAKLENNRWIHVTGRIVNGTLEYESGRFMMTPYVQADAVESIEPPRDPYVYRR